MKQTLRTPVRIPLDVGRLDGTLAVPPEVAGLVLFAHGSGSSYQNPRRQPVATLFQERGLATLLFDLLTPVEDSKHGNRFNVGLLTERLLLATEWVQRHADVPRCPLGYLGVGAGAAAALQAGATLADNINAIVCSGGRPDLTGEQTLNQVTAPTLFLVGGRDTSVIALNREALSKMNCEKQMRVVAGATHSFDEPGKLEQVASDAADWFIRHLKS